MFGVTRQAHYQHNWYQECLSTEHHLIIKEVKQIRQFHRCMGTRKLYEKIQDFLLEHNIKMGRGALFDLLASNGLLVRKRRRTISTTMSYHRYHKWPNLINGFVPSGINQLYVSDITYWKIKTGYIYISLITDAYSHKIVGYNVADNLETMESRKALELALHGFGGRASQLIHHSDRGLQYCSSEYVKLLQQHGIRISMTETSEPTDNAIAERVNGILKNEYLLNYEVDSLDEAKKLLDQTIRLYNKERPHMSVGMLTPEIVHEHNLKTEKVWKTYPWKKRNIVNPLQDELKTVNL
ncbi:MAG: IS3 family transposase [Opitutaceae bacterium]|nr:IS3 family transposase [Cytophagales bacterium]